MKPPFIRAIKKWVAFLSQTQFHLENDDDAEFSPTIAATNGLLTLPAMELIPSGCRRLAAGLAWPCPDGIWKWPRWPIRG